MSVCRLGLGSLLVGWLALGCGLRSDPLFEGDLIDEAGTGAGTIDAGTDPGASACDAPIEMPVQNITVNGQLSGGNHERGWCGQDDGPEQVYSLTVPYNVDVTLAVTKADSPLTLRIVEDGCSDGEGRTVMCANDFVDAPHHFFALAGHTYSIIVDSEDGASGEFSFDAVFGWPTIDQCTVHDEVIFQQPGGSFVWFNDFGRGQGDVDGACGGPGRDNMFPVQVSYPGNIYVDVTASGGLSPVVSLRTSCAGVSELTCSSGGANGTASMTWFIDASSPEYYLVVDQATIDGGSYGLSVFFD
ncbi:MAG: hypothetical protein IPH07_05935 [Deltaproteobacteria bacterium]|nr:hypothetical protein [Deltaproteobacteria bacterium]MBP7291368.1 hypothetical protein [Nannocystaceae bacterium]